MLWLRLLVVYGKRCHHGEYFDGGSQNLDLQPLAHSKVFSISYGFTEALETPVFHQTSEVTHNGLERP